MRMNHLDLYVPDVRATTDFLTRYFGLTLVAMRGEGGLAILNDESGMEIVISHPIEKLGGADQATRGRETYHIGFMLPERGDVDRLWQALHDGGEELAGEPKAMRGGWLFYCTAPGRVLIEVGWRP
ncbi:MAG: Lactoylglutathione lyase-like lyase [Sphingomonas bacterium]|nr:Lactoylglutathione lyase-like lyase [Sphingomonas bacterium]